MPYFSDCRILYSMDTVLEDMNGVRYFREFLRRNRVAELLLFWMEVEIYRDFYNEQCSDSTVLKKQRADRIYAEALRIFDTFIRDDAVYKLDEGIVDYQCGAHIAAILGMDDKYNVLASSQSQIRMRRLDKVRSQ